MPNKKCTYSYFLNSKFPFSLCLKKWTIVTAVYFVVVAIVRMVFPYFLKGVVVVELVEIVVVLVI